MEKLTKIIESTELNNDTLFSTLCETYERLKLKNVPIPDDIQIKVEKKLLEYQFITKNAQPINEEFKLLTEHFNFTCAIIKEFLSKYLGNEFEPNLEFVFWARYIAQNMSVLKRRINYTYDIVPWEEMQFCLVIYIFSLTQPSETDVIYKLVLDKNRVLQQLSYFYKKLKEVQINFKEENLQLKRSANRNITKNNILKQSPDFKYLYDDFQILKDVHSLTKMKFYLKQALSISMTQNNIVNQLVIERTLQVIGEYLKNTVESPNLSESLYKSLVRSAPRNLRSILGNVRNMLSHAFSLNRKLELEGSKDSHFFQNVQRDLEKIHVEIVHILYQQKINAVKIFLNKIMRQHCLDDVKCIFREANIAEIETIAESNSYSEDFSKVKELIYLFCQKVLEDPGEDTCLIDEVKSIIEVYKTKIDSVSSIFIEVMNKIFELQQNKKDLPTIHNLARTYLVSIAFTEPQNLFNEVFKKLHNIYENFKRRRNYDANNFLKPDTKAIELGNIIIEIYNSLKWRMRRITWIEEIENQLELKIDVDQEKIQKICKIFEAVEKKLEKDEDKNIFRSAITQKTQLHLNKTEILSVFDKDIETFERILKSLNLSTKRERDVLYNFETKKFDRLQLLVKEINDDYGTLVKQLGDIFPLNKYLNTLKTFHSSLKLKKPLQLKIMKAIEIVVQEEVIYSYGKRLEVLKNLVIHMDFQSRQENSCYFTTAIEMLVLDLMEYLENVKLLGNNKLFLIESLPILKGKQLRNYLAHGDALIDLLPYNPLISITFYAEKLIKLGTDILAQNDILLGNKINNCENNDLQEYFLKCLKCCKSQEILYDFIKTNDYCNVLETINTGAELQGISLNGWTAFDFVVSIGNLKLFKFILNGNNELTEEMYNYLNTAVISGKLDIVEYIFNKFKVDVNYKYQNNLTLLHLALKYGHTRITNFLINNNANIYDKSTSGKTTLIFALEGKNTELAHSLLDTNADLINVFDYDNNTVLHVAVQNNHSGIVQVLLDKNVNFHAIRKDGLTAFELAAQYGHGNILKIFLQTTSFELSSNILIRAVFLAAENGHLNIVWPILENSMDINTKNSSGETILHGAAFYGYKMDVIMLIRNKANLKISSNNGCTAIHLACQCGHIEIINILLENGSDINAIDNNQWTPLHCATQKSHQNVVKLLLSQNANSELYNQNGKLALHLAAVNGDIDIFNILLEHTSDANTKTKGGYTALHLAAENGHSALVNTLLNTFNIDINSKTENDDTPLILAANNGHHSVVEQLLKHGASINDKNKKEGFTALTRAAAQGHTDIVTILIKNKADMEIQETSGWRALHYAVQNGYLDILEILLKNGVDVNSKYDKNGTALHTATRNGHTEIVQKLIKYRANVQAIMLSLLPLRVAAHFGHIDILLMLLNNGANINATGSDNVSPLHSSAWNGHIEVVKLLLKKGADINSQTEEQWTALHYAAKFGYYDIVMLLVENGADINTKNNFGVTAFHLACEMGYSDIVLIFLERFKVNIDMKSTDGSTGLHWASANGRINVLETLITNRATVNIKANDESTPLHWASQYSGSIDIVHILIKNNAEVNVKDAKGATPLHLASLNGYKNIVEALLHKNADINAENNEVTALHLVASFGHYDIMKLLLEKGADVNKKGLYERTGLHLAAEKGHIDILNILIENGAEINVADTFGMTSLHLAVEKGHTDIVNLLIKNDSNINTKNNKGYTPLYSAINNNHKNIAVLLIANHAEIETTYNDSTILHHATRKGMISVVSALIDRGISLDIECNKNTPLMESLHNNYEDIAVLLIENKANVMMATSTGWTPLHVSAGKGYHKVCNSLIRAKAAINSKTLDWETPLFFASLQGHYDIVLDLLTHNADVNVQTKSKGHTALTAAAQEGHAEIIQMLVKHHADVNVRSQRYLTPLHLSSLYGHVKCVQILLECQAIVTSKTDNNWTPLHIASSEGYLEIVKLLLENTVDNLDDKTDEGATPLLLAVEQGHKGIVQELLKYKANSEIIGANGLKPIELATQKEFGDIAEILLKEL